MNGLDHYALLGLGVIAIMAMVGALAFGLWSIAEAVMGKGDEE